MTIILGAYAKVFLKIKRFKIKTKERRKELMKE